MDEIKATQLADGILHIVFNRPAQLNALSGAMMHELYAIIKQAKTDTAIKAVLLSGEGKVFCAGVDIKQLAPLNAQQGLLFARHGQQIFHALETLGKPSLAAMHGMVLGGGCELAMATTLRIATDNTLFGQPEIKLGIIPGFGGTQRLSRLIGKGRAMAMCLTGQPIPAQQALQWGLLNEVVAAEQLINRGVAILKSIIGFSSIAIESILSVIQQGSELTLEDGLELEAAHFGLCCASADKQEGVTAFLEKRIAHFAGE